MALARNPFTPGFGKHPPVVVGRDRLLAEIGEAYSSEWHPARKTLLQAHRGSGKTVLLDAIQDLATEAGWFVVQEDAGTHGVPIAMRMVARLQAYVEDRDPKPRRQLTGGSVSVLGVGASVSTSSPEETPEPSQGLREALEVTLSLESDRPNGVLLSIDEIHEASREDIHTIGNAIQHLDREGAPIAALLAGLPPGAEVEKEPTFLSRCYAPAIESLTDEEISAGLVATVDTVDWVFEPDALQLATNASAGYPYMMQLVGWQAFDHARSSHKATISSDDVERGLPDATRTLTRSVLSQIDQRLSPTETEFLMSMANDTGPSRMKAIGERMDQSGQYVNVYRTRLLDAGLIRQVRHGYVDFVLPGHRAELRASVGFAATVAARERKSTINRPHETI